MIFYIGGKILQIAQKKPVHRLKCLLNTVASVKIAVDFTLIGFIL